ncbi:hypothetical protein BB559_002280 [Furculomyces boomerangus]|uniref:Velvet domain-containing protein n=2 Tax=Harpellales TaxID=61421 RepID=A0A2T9YWJ6_9FUNG|nr:hypothetical protein BB559_002280 [Furculomyces boomerangus]PVZ97077.1 hypothetical protein BB558_006989 [Smittium angustum]PWA02603.1 hypothetical protein BB558_001267 [Smittium angustum]
MNYPIMELEILQQPKRACVVEMGERYRRPIDPPPILRLNTNIIDESAFLEFMNSNVIAVHANLVSEESTENIDNIVNTYSSLSRSTFNSFSKKEGRVLLGSLTASCNIVRGLSDEKSCYFVFPDLYVSIEGTYRLKFSLVVIPSTSEAESVNARVSSYLISDSFIAFPSSEFPGVEESSLLSKTLAEQGVGIPIRNKSRLKR